MLFLLTTIPEPWLSISEQLNPKFIILYTSKIPVFYSQAVGYRDDGDPMKIRNQALILVIFMTAAIIGIIHGIANVVLLRGSAALEEQETRRSIMRTTNALANELSDMDGKVADWAFWDDTYVFVQDANENYVTLNLADSTFENLRLNVMMFVNTSGHIVHSKTFDLETKSETAVPESLFQEVETHTEIWNHTTSESKILGIVLLPEGPIIVASKPILNSQGEGPIRGALIFGRKLDSYEMEYLSTTVGLALMIQNLGGQELPSDFQSAYTTLSTSGDSVQTLNADSIAGYTMIRDVYGQPVAIMRVDLPRDISKQFTATFSYFMWSIVIACFIFGVTIMVSLQKAIISPLSRLTFDIKTMGRSHKVSSRVPKMWTDEMLILSQAIKDTVSQRMATIEELAGMVGHDLRNPLTGIAGATYYIKSKHAVTMDAKSREMLGIIEESIDHSNKIINDLLEYSGKTKLQLTPTNPKSLVDKAVLLASVPHNIQLIELTKEEPLFKADVHKLVRCFTNIVKNAVDAMPNGGTLVIKSREHRQNVELTFTDTGAGISKETLEKLWTPLFTTKAKGMGFGLAITKRFVEAHGGSISITSTLGKGTTVTVTIPAKVAETDEAEVWTELPEPTQILPQSNKT